MSFRREPGARPNEARTRNAITHHDLLCLVSWSHVSAEKPGNDVVFEYKLVPKDQCVTALSFSYGKA